MALLSLFRFTNVAKGGDLATAPTDPATGGWQNTTLVQTQAGDDVIQATGVFADLPEATYGSTGTTPVLYKAAIANGGLGKIDMGNGKDISVARHPEHAASAS